MPGLVIDVHELTGNPGVSKGISTNEPLPGLRGVLAYVGDEEPLGVELEAESLIEGVLVQGTVSGTFHVTCSRCLAGYDQHFEQHVDEVFYYRPAEEDIYSVEAGVIDLEPVVRDAVVLAIPIHPLHKDGCLGLCPQCGADRNLVDCGHKQEIVDIRWAPLKDFFSKPIQQKVEGS